MRSIRYRCKATGAACLSHRRAVSEAALIYTSRRSVSSPARGLSGPSSFRHRSGSGGSCAFMLHFPEERGLEHLLM